MRRQCWVAVTRRANREGDLLASEMPRLLKISEFLAMFCWRDNKYSFCSTGSSCCWSKEATGTMVLLDLLDDPVTALEALEQESDGSGEEFWTAQHMRG